MPQPLTPADKARLIELIQNDRPLPKEDLYKLAADEEDVFLFWNGRNEEVTRAVLPFHHIEHIDEPRREASHDGDQFSLFDRKGRQRAGWHNKLIWGDNKLILSSLAHGPLRRQIEAEGGLKLVYIDPPFAVGADFSHQIEIGGESATKSQTILEEIAYRDTWQRGTSSYLSMMYERLKLIHSLMAEDGSIYVHVDYRVVNYLKLLLDTVFGFENYHNQVTWKRSSAHSNAKQGAKGMGEITDSILWYTKSYNFTWNVQYQAYDEEYVRKNYRMVEEGSGRKFQPVDLTANRGGGDTSYEWKGFKLKSGRYWAYSKANMEKFETEGKLYYTKSGLPRLKYYIDEMPGIPLQDIWTDINPPGSQSNERVGYPTQKPEALLERIIKASSNEGDLVADFFCGSGTTAAVAEKLNRKWIATDLGRFAVHTTRKRLIGVQRELKDAGKDFRAFELLNLGKYERQFFLQSLSEEQERSKEQAYLNLIREAYQAEALTGAAGLHGTKGGRVIHIGPLDVPVTETRVREAVESCRRLGYTQLDVLGFEFEQGMSPRVIQEAGERDGVRIRLRYIPKDVFDPRAVKKGQAKFYDVSYLRASAAVSKDVAPASAPNDGVVQVTVTLEDFVTNYTQEDLDTVEASLQKGKSAVVMDGGQIVKVTMDKRGVQDREILTKDWHDWIDYWSVDFNYDSKKEILRLQDANGEVTEHWTGNYIFENEWQSFRTRQDRSLEFTTSPRAYVKPGKYRIMVKVVDILGVDTSQLLEVTIK